MIELFVTLVQENKGPQNYIQLRITGDSFPHILHQVEAFIKAYNKHPQNGEKIFDWYICEIDDIISSPIKIELDHNDD